MNVSDIMSSAPVTVQRDTPVEEVARIMSEHGVSGLPVVDRDGTLVGMISEEDMIVRNANLHLPSFLNVLDGFFPVRGRHEFEEEMRHMLATQAGEVMSEHLYVVGPDADVSDAATLMVEHHANPLPVTQNGRVIGIVSRSDIIRLMARQETSNADNEPTPGA